MPDTEKIASFAGKKILRLVSLLAVVCFVSFMLIQYSPIDPVRAYIGEMTVSEEHKAKLEEYWGVNTPPQEKFLNWAGNILKGGDFGGVSLIYRMPVADVIKERAMASFVLMATSWLFSGVLGFILGIVAGMNKGTWIDRAIKTYCYVLAATPPTFWLALVLLMVFSVSLGVVPDRPECTHRGYG